MERLEEKEFTKLCQAVAGEALTRLAEVRGDSASLIEVNTAWHECTKRITMLEGQLELAEQLNENLTEEIQNATNIAHRRGEENADLLKRLAALKS